MAKTQLKFIVEQSLADQFKQAVLQRRGKLDLSHEGEEALRLYLKEKAKASDLPKKDPLLDAIGMFRSTGGRVNALDDERRLYEDRR